MIKITTNIIKRQMLEQYRYQKPARLLGKRNMSVVSEQVVSAENKESDSEMIEEKEPLANLTEETKSMVPLAEDAKKRDLKLCESLEAVMEPEQVQQSNMLDIWHWNVNHMKTVMRNDRF